MDIARIIKKYFDLGIRVELGRNNQLEIEAPEDILTKNITDEIKKYKKEIILFFSNRESITQRHSIQNVNNKNQEYILSNAQKRLWVLDQLEEDNTTYNMPVSFVLEGELKIDAFKQAYSFMIARHESLRTVFIIRDGEPRQKILQDYENSFDFIDLQYSNDPEKEAQSIVQNNLLTPFNLENGPLVRFSIVRIEDVKHLLLFNMHHIISDGWSMNVFIEEFLKCYNCFKKGDSPDFKPLRIHYKDYSAWQNNILESSEMDEHRKYWLNKLSGEIPVLDLPADKIRPVSQTFNGDRMDFNLPQGINSALNDLCRDNKASMFMMLQALIKVLFHRYTGQTDIILGSPIAGRIHRDLKDQIGFYVNTLVVRDTISGDLSFKEILESVGKSCTEAFDNQDYPFDRIVEDLDIKRDFSRSPLFDVMLTLHNNESNEAGFDGLNVFSYKTEKLISKFDLSFEVFEHSKGLNITIEYNTDIYTKDRIIRMFEHLKTLINSVLEDMESRIKDLQIIPEDERKRLLYGFNNTEVDFPKDKTIVQVFEEQVDKTPDNIAVVYEYIKLTYRELNERANMVAHYLQEKYLIGSDDFVGIVLDRSEKLLASILGILKAGGAYIPVDPDYPIDRKIYILEDSNLKGIIGEKRSTDFIDLKLESIFIDIDDVLGADLNRLNPENRAKPDDLAYVIYTSGSTGKPKGAMVEHIGMMNHIYSKINLLGVTSMSRIVQNASQCFDISVWQLLTVLLKGGTTYIYNNDLILKPAEMINKVIEDKITILEVVPTFLFMLIEEIDKDTTLTDLEYCLVTGEEVKKELVQQWFDNFPDIKLVNAYGPTEASDDITHFVMDEVPENSIISIGKPIQNMNIYIIDKNFKLCPIGINGEIVVSGVGVGRGYVNNRERTALSFLNNPFIENEVVRLYKTGDLGRWLPDGNIEFLGRLDNQVKIRGFRIELGEIESSLVQHKDISSSVVLAIEGNNGEKQLIAYIVSDNEFEPSDLRWFLDKLLPDYMIPSYFIHIEKIPLTSNGKIDRKVLPEPDGNIYTSSEFIAPRNETEEKLVEIWQEVLGIERIGIHDSFFDLGGHSLKATKVVSRISKELEVIVSLKEIFENYTIETLSDVIINANKTDYRQIEIIQEKNFYDISNAQRRLWILDQFEEDSIAYNIPSAFVLEGELNIDAFRQAFSFMVERHESLKTVFVIENGEPKQKILENPGFDVVVFNLKDSIDTEKEARMLAKKDLMTPFDLETGPLVRFTVAKIDHNKNLLLFNMHHIISDGWSVNIFIGEFLGAYKSFRGGKSPDLKPLRIQYKDYSTWQNNLLESPFINNQRKYWLDKLSGDLPVLELPSDKIRPTIKTFNGNSIGFYFSEEIYCLIKKLCKENKISLFMILQALVKVLFHRYTGQTDIIIGSPVAGRVHEDLENQIGFFVNTLILRDTILGDSSFIEILNGIRKSCTEAFDNQDYPFDRLVEDLDIKRDLSRSPLFDVMLVLQNNEESEFDFDGLSISPYRNENMISKFDMTFNFTESEGSLFCKLEYNTDIYSEERIKRMIGHLRTLVSSVIEKPESRIKDFGIIPDDEIELLLKVFNDPKVDNHVDKTIIEVFEEQVKKTPNNIAVIFENIELSYRELNEKANIVGHYLRKNYNINSDVLVGVFLERSENMIIALLGILKSGAAYVPIDTEYPRARIDYMLDDSNPIVVFGSRSTSFANYVEILDIDAVLESSENTNNIEYITESDNLAYVIYTSGSTGKPKGTLLEHSGLVNMALNQIEGFGIVENDNILQFASTSFDASMSEIFMALFSGSSLVIVDEESKKDSNKFQKIIIGKNVTVATLPPSYLININEKVINRMRVLITAGEKPIITDVVNYYSSLKYINAYGPTEASVCTSFYCVDSESFNQSEISIGKPISNTQVFILDANQHLLPQGIPGELCISGIGLARGYLNQSELTKEKFVVNPFYPDVRMYRTGDFARWMPDGNIEFLGRIDNQVKIRGYRIELEEIENSLVQHKNIRSVVVLATEGKCEERQLIAYYISDKKLNLSEVRGFLGKSLPDYMIPSYFIHMEVFPLNANGKIDRKLLPEPEGHINTSLEYTAARNEIEEKLVEIWQEVLKIDQIGIHDNFFELGGNSLKLIKLSSLINKEFNFNISVLMLYTYTTIQSLVENVFKERSSYKNIDLKRSSTYTNDSQEIAIIGMSGRFPGAENISKYWNNLKEGIESITRFTKEELKEIGINEKTIENPDYIKAFGTIKDKEFFDAGFFGYSPVDAEIMNPQIRIFHEEVWSALEDGGYNPEDYSGSIGIFSGGSQNLNWIAGAYLSNSGCSSLEIAQLAEISFMSSRISHKFNLRGPSTFTNTACSTSLVNIVMACENLILNRCDMALAGGISIGAETKSGYLYSEGSISSPDGHCRAFSRQAAGTVSGEGAGVVLLKKLDNALRDNDNIHAVIKGYGMNNDGNRKVGYTAPSVLGQAELIRDVQQRAGIEPDSITYIEAHGTGTIMGDPIEVEALKIAFNTNRKQFCGIGSVKSNIGHLDSAAGIAGVIKTVQSIKNRQLPPTIHADIPNPLLQLEDSPFYLNTAFKCWESDGAPLRAGVSSFGIGGTNAHLILEEAPGIEEAEQGKSYEVINLSAKSKSSLDNNIKNLARFLKECKETNLSDISYTLNVGRKHFNYRYSITVSSIDELIERLEEQMNSQLPTSQIRSDIHSDIIFMFPGQGSQYKNMGIDLYQKDNLFRKEVDCCLDILLQDRNIDFKEVLFGESDINESQNSSCSIFIIEYALSKLLQARGINPDYMIGHSLGEFTAACISGVLSLKDALILVYDRGLLINKLPTGSMLSVFIEREKLIPLLDNTVSLAVENSDSLFVISGSIKSIKKFSRKLAGLGYNAKLLKTTHAFHSFMLDPVLEEYKDLLREMDFRSPQIPYISNVTGKQVKPEEVRNIDHWMKHFRETVQFNSGTKELLKTNHTILIEVGPGKYLTSLIKSNSNKGKIHRIVNILKSPKEEINDYQYFQSKISELWISGAFIDWNKHYENENRRRISLPTYAFDKTYYGKNFNVMFDSPKINQANSSNSSKDKALTYIPSWKRVELPQVDNKEKYNYLVFIDDLGISEKLADRLIKLGNRVIRIRAGNIFLKISNSDYIINHNLKDDYCKLFDELKENDVVFDKIIHSWSIANEYSDEITIDSIYRDQEFGFYSALNILKVIDEMNYKNHLDIYFLSSDIQSVIGNERISPSKSTLLGLVNVIKQEYSNIDSYNIDFSMNDIPSKNNRITEQIIRELLNEEKNSKIAYRGSQRWIQRFKPVELNDGETRFKNNGVYLITGGLGRIGLIISRFLAEKFNSKLILTTRQNFPKKKDWERILEDNNESKYKSKILELLEIERLGAEVFVFQADVSFREEMEEVLSIVEESINCINGVIHCAGLLDLDLIKKQEIIKVEEMFTPKINGAIVLDQIFREKDLDFTIYCSSLASITGGLGMSSYSAANQFMDSYANLLQKRGDYPVISINWPGWQENDLEIDSGNRSNDQSFLISSKEAVKLLEIISGEDYSIVVPYITGLNEYVRKTNFIGRFKDIDIISEENYFSRPDMEVEYCPPTNEIEKRIIKIWQELLGIDGIGINDDFFELGGHSLKGASYITQIRDIFDINLPYDQMYKYSTIRQISQFITNLESVKNVNKSNNEKREVFEL